MRVHAASVRRTFSSAHQVPLGRPSPGQRIALHNILNRPHLQPQPVAVGHPDDAFEREAERAADTVLHGPGVGMAAALGDPRLQRQPAEAGTVTESQETAWGFANPGKVEDVGATGVSAQPNEFLFWNFLVGRSDLRAAHATQLRAIAPRWRDLLTRARPDLRVKIIGSASQSGSAATNERLALERAAKVRDFLVQAGIPADRIEAVGVGNREPLADPTSAENLARNRRVEFFLFSPLTEVKTLGATVQPEVLDFAPSFAIREAIDFNPASNFYAERLVTALMAFALVKLSGPSDSEMGFLQFLTGDVRQAVYDVGGGRQVVLDYSRCTSPFLPCRDVEEATNRFSFQGPGRSTGPGADPKLLIFDDSPGIVAPLRDPFSGLRGTLVKTRWAMRFALVLGARSGGDFLPIRHLVWRLASNRDVDVAGQSAVGSPDVLEVSRGPGMPAGVNLASATSLRTCRFLTRRMDLPPAFARVCRPAVTVS